MSDSSEETPYSGMSDEEFVAELSRHLADRSWTFGHWRELSQRDGLTIDDGELSAALSEERQQFAEAVNKALAPVREAAAQAMAPWQDHLREVVARTAATIDYSKLLPKINVDRLVDPGFRQVEVGTFGTAVAGIDDALPADTVPTPSVLDAIAESSARRLNEEAEYRTSMIQLVTVAIEQKEALGRIESELTKANRRDPIEWILVGAAVIAAVTGVIGLFMIGG